MAWQTLIGKLTIRHQQFDQQLTAILEKAQQNRLQIYCREGCGNCCTLAVNCSFPEAMRIAQQLDVHQKVVLQNKVVQLQSVAQEATDFKLFLRRFRQQIKGCPFLDPATQTCTVYAERPLSCRAMLSTRSNDWCGVDFADLHPLKKKIFVDSLDSRIVALPTHYLAESQELGSYTEASVLTDMHDAFGMNLGGNLIYLVWLELEFCLSKLIEINPESAMDLLTRENETYPFLLQFSFS